jgi:hypothetical protein
MPLNRSRDKRLARNFRGTSENGKLNQFQLVRLPIHSFQMHYFAAYCMFYGQ